MVIRKIGFFLCVILLIFAVGCSVGPKPACEFCSSPATREEVGPDGQYICETCWPSSVKKCINCGVFYPYSVGENTKEYCFACVEDYAGTCDICGGGKLNLFNMVNVTADYHICAPCLEEYYESRDASDLEAYVVTNSCLTH